MRGLKSVVETWLGQTLSGHKYRSQYYAIVGQGDPKPCIKNTKKTRGEGYIPEKAESHAQGPAARNVQNRYYRFFHAFVTRPVSVQHIWRICLPQKRFLKVLLPYG